MAEHRTAVIVSYRLGGVDGVSVEAAKWEWALGGLGYAIRTVAGQDTADIVIEGLGIEADGQVDSELLGARVRSALDGASLVVAENICSLPLNPGASAAVTEALRGRRAVLHHHDLATQRPQLAHFGLPRDDSHWHHVTVNELSRLELAAAGIEATVIHNHFDPDPPRGRREELRACLDVGSKDVLLLQPTRAVQRKNIPAAIAFAGQLATEVPTRVVYWLLGPAEDGYGSTLERDLAAATAPVRHGFPTGSPWSMHDAYAACDAVLFPSTWEGFGNPAIEASTHDRPLVIGHYPVAAELAGYGFRWFDPGIPTQLATFLRRPDTAVLTHNHGVARRHFALSDLPGKVAKVLGSGSV